MAVATKTREILVILNGGKRRRVSGIPANAKITYGPITPGKYSHEGNALRIYTSTNNQLAIFTGVQEFRDLSLVIEEQKVVRNSKSESEAGPKGRKASEELEETYEWESV